MSSRIREYESLEAGWWFSYWYIIRTCAPSCSSNTFPILFLGPSSPRVVGWVFSPADWSPLIPIKMKGDWEGTNHINVPVPASRYGTQFKRFHPMAPSLWTRSSWQLRAGSYMCNKVRLEILGGQEARAVCSLPSCSWCVCPLCNDVNVYVAIAFAH